MDAALRELLAAQEEHARALAAAGDAQAQLQTAQSEFAAASAAEAQRERELDAALQSLDITSDSLSDLAVATTANADAAVATPAVPSVVAFVMEFQRNIGCYQCFIQLRDARRLEARQLRVRVAFPTVTLTVVREDGSGDELVCWTTEIERNVDEANCVASVQVDYVHVRLPVKDGDKELAGDGFASFTQVDAAELRAANYARLVCRACDSVLVDAAGARIERVQPLPSANWVDMFDFWGAGIGAFEHLPRDDIFAQPARVYVGEVHVLLHDANVVAGALERSETATSPLSAASTTNNETRASGTGDDGEDDDAKQLWEPLRCATCAAALGMRHRENAATIRLDKHVIASRRGATEDAARAGDDVFARYTVDSVVCARLLEFADSDGVFRFTLRSPEAARDESSGGGAGGEAMGPSGSQPPPPLLLQLLSWETTVKAPPHVSEFRRVLKVLYAPDASSTRAQDSLAVAPATQDLIFSPAICAAVASRLETSTKLLPASLRAFNKMAVGYLFA
ncbi:hypothetical protein PybrP1_012286 [[Pythium] brassicae (nom. inval.)]|nr:hypothetical protein PybrP1_012286 [[Pythium] brassicae (nom. inval.)]